MTGPKSRRNFLFGFIFASVSAIAARFIPGCAATTPPNGTPTTGPSGNSLEDDIYRAVAAAWPNIVTGAQIAMAVPGLIPAQDDALIQAAINQGNVALSTWATVLDTPAANQLSAEFSANLAAIVQLIAQAKASKVGTTVAGARLLSASRAKAHLRR